MKQTAVEWLVEQMINQMGIRIKNTTIGVKLFDQAKEMEKEQIIDACNQTDVIGLDHEQPGEQYFNKTFNTKEK